MARENAELFYAINTFVVLELRFLPEFLTVDRTTPSNVRNFAQCPKCKKENRSDFISPTSFPPQATSQVKNGSMFMHNRQTPSYSTGVSAGVEPASNGSQASPLSPAWRLPRPASSVPLFPPRNVTSSLEVPPAKANTTT